MSCYNECNAFLKTKSEKDLGDIKKDGDCAYCLYYNVGPATDGDYTSHDCVCNNLYEQITGNGSQYDLESHNIVKQCLTQNQDTCGKLYKQFTNPDKPYDGPRFALVEGMWGRLERYEDNLIPKRFRDYGKNSFKENNYSCGYTCDGKKASPGFSYEGVL